MCVQVSVHVLGPREVAACPADGTGVVVVSFLLHFGFSIAQLALKEFLRRLLLKVCAFSMQAFFYGNVSPASGLPFCYMFFL